RHGLDRLVILDRRQFLGGVVDLHKPAHGVDCGIDRDVDRSVVPVADRQPAHSQPDGQLGTRLPGLFWPVPHLDVAVQVPYTAAPPASARVTPVTLPVSTCTPISADTGTSVALSAGVTVTLAV